MIKLRSKIEKGLNSNGPGTGTPAEEKFMLQTNKSFSGRGYLPPL
jgi:hypothetical protein